LGQHTRTEIITAISYTTLLRPKGNSFILAFFRFYSILTDESTGKSQIENEQFVILSRLKNDVTQEVKTCQLLCVLEPSRADADELQLNLR